MLEAVGPEVLGQRLLDTDDRALDRTGIDGRRRRRFLFALFALLALFTALLLLLDRRRLHLDTTHQGQQGLDLDRRQRAIQWSHRPASDAIHVHARQVCWRRAVCVAARQGELHLHRLGNAGGGDIADDGRRRTQRRQRGALLPARAGDREHTDEQSAEQEGADGTHGPPIVLCGRRVGPLGGQREGVPGVRPRPERGDSWQACCIFSAGQTSGVHHEDLTHHCRLARWPRRGGLATGIACRPATAQPRRCVWWKLGWQLLWRRHEYGQHGRPARRRQHALGRWHRLVASERTLVVLRRRAQACACVGRR